MNGYKNGRGAKETPISNPEAKQFHIFIFMDYPLWKYSRETLEGNFVSCVIFHDNNTGFIWFYIYKIVGLTRENFEKKLKVEKLETFDNFEIGKIAKTFWIDYPPSFINRLV